MEAAERVNISGSMKSLEVGESFSLDRREYKLSTAKTTAAILKYDTGKEFAVSIADGKNIMVRRTK